MKLHTDFRLVAISMIMNDFQRQTGVVFLPVMIWSITQSISRRS